VYNTTDYNYIMYKGPNDRLFFSRASKSSECFTAPKHNNKPLKLYSENHTYSSA